jgi:hypothetical protein
VDTADLTDVSLCARWNRHRRVLIPIIVAVVLVGAFLGWGPIGLGNGPLNASMYGAGSGGVSGRLPVGVETIIYNTGGSALVIDSVQLLGDGSYPAPHVLATEAMSETDCGFLSPVRSTADGFVLSGCGGRPLGPLDGRAVGSAGAVMAVFKIGPPRHGGCWLATRIVTHYHVGIRHYAATDPFVVAACAGGAKAESAASAIAQSALS